MNKNEWNNLMLAIRDNPAAIPDHLYTMRQFPIENKIALLTQTNPDGWSAFRLANYYCPEILPHFFDFLTNPTQKENVNLLKKICFL